MAVYYAAVLEYTPIIGYTAKSKIVCALHD